MEIIRRLSLGWNDNSITGRYQYIYSGGCGRISLIYIKCHGGEFMWETHSIDELSYRFDGRFETKEKAEEFIMEKLGLTDLAGLIQWRIAKKNMIITEE